MLELTTSTSLEKLGKEALSTLSASFNSRLDTVQSLMNAYDVANGYETITVEHIAPEHFYHGHRPSLVDADVSMYPNCAVMAWSSRPGAELLDHLNINVVQLFVELMAKSYDNEYEVNARIQRMADAAHDVLMDDRTLGGLVFEIADAPSVVLTEVFQRAEVRGHGPRFLWQGARMDYTITKYAAIT